VTQEWIAARLAMRSAANVSQQLRRFDRQAAQAQLPEKLRNFLAGAWSEEKA
jgi:putative transposase